MITDRCPDCGETAIEICTICENQTYCPNCDRCIIACSDKTNEKEINKTIHLTIRITPDLDDKLNIILKNELRKNPLIKKSDIVRTLMYSGLDKFGL